MAPRTADDQPEVKAVGADGDNPEPVTGDSDDQPREGRRSGTAYLNTTSTPLVYDKEGRQVDAAGWTPEVVLDEVGKAARKAGYLLAKSAL